MKLEVGYVPQEKSAPVKCLVELTERGFSGDDAYLVQLLQGKVLPLLNTWGLRRYLERAEYREGSLTLRLLPGPDMDHFEILGYDKSLGQFFGYDGGQWYFSTGDTDDLPDMPGLPKMANEHIGGAYRPDPIDPARVKTPWRLWMASVYKHLPRGFVSRRHTLPENI
ncbi:hypothetical protein DKM44_14430 [Deinococcus irradiatisoli]|uniref:Uncharacterized protein n=1 Tax=Deinococcus irradiatisoli TaxID=2202254 RepID=A0A2Z3JSQ8_9DEIO|nr:hypothetical protein [Deinococcus irradiatisoli]AWN24278.1 hypothetical protein DKM44_14430 [Deinococcus irradiatisoli]